MRKEGNQKRSEEGLNSYTPEVSFLVHTIKDYNNILLMIPTFLESVFPWLRETYVAVGRTFNATSTERASL